MQQMTKACTVFFSAALMLVALMSSAQDAESLPAGLAVAAKQGLARFLDSGDQSSLRKSRIIPADARGAATLGRPFLMHQILPSDLDAYDESSSSSDVITPTTQYYFPVIFSGEIRALLIVDRVKGEWKAVSMGYPELAYEVGLIRESWPASGGDDVVFAASNQARRFFFVVPHMGKRNLTPVQCPSADPQNKQREKYSRLQDLSETIPGLKEKVKAGQRDGVSHRVQPK